MNSSEKSHRTRDFGTFSKDRVTHSLTTGGKTNEVDNCQIRMGLECHDG